MAAAWSWAQPRERTEEVRGAQQFGSSEQLGKQLVLPVEKQSHARRRDPGCSRGAKDENVLTFELK